MTNQTSPETNADRRRKAIYYTIDEIAQLEEQGRGPEADQARKTLRDTAPTEYDDAGRLHYAPWVLVALRRRGLSERP